jgi:hypothetical protein
MDVNIGKGGELTLFLWRRRRDLRDLIEEFRNWFWLKNGSIYERV